VRSLVLGDARPGIPELVVVPGLGALGYLLPAVRRCAARTRVHLLDLPGFGSPRTAGCPSSLQDVSAAASAWLTTVPGAPVVLVGHSTGGQAALRAAVASPEAVSGLVLSGITFPPQARRPLPLLRRVARTLVHESPREVPAVAREYVRGGGRLLQLLLSSLHDRPEDHVGSVTSPLHVVRGRHDHLCDAAWADSLAARAPRGRSVELPGAHNTPTTHPEQTAAAWCALAVDSQL
jgi:pimeloyl-ACP methyl ester carboxylesterase